MSIVIPSLNYGTVVGRFLVELGDSTDEDNRPDVLPAKGFVTFTPSISYATVQDSEPEPAVLFPQKVIGVLDSEGYLSTAQYDALNNKYFQTVDGQYIPSRRGVSLQATDDFSLNPYDWTWRVDFSLRYPGANFTFPGFDFRLPSEHTLDLVQAIPIETSAGEFSLIGPRGERGPRGYGIEDISATDGIIRIKWEGGDDVTIPSAPLATPTSDGLMPKEDKAKLDSQDIVTRQLNEYIPGASGGTFRVMRYGALCIATFYNFRYAASTGFARIGTIPLGLRPVSAVSANSAGVYAANAPTTPFILLPTGHIETNRTETEGTINLTLTYLTRDEIPNPWPGTPG